MNKRVLSIFLALVMVIGTVGVANAATGNPKIDWLIEKEYVKGDAGTGNLRLTDTITRAEATAMIVRAQGLEVLAGGFSSTDSKFKDLPITHWANGYINVAISTGVVNGYPDSTFKPENKITYAEVIKMLVVVNGDLPKGTNVGSWEVPYITKASEVGILKDIAITTYSDYATRGKIFEMVYNVVSKDVAVGLETYKGIVIENERVKGLDDNEIEIEVIERASSTSNYRYDKASSVRITLPKELGEGEELLGKVVNITINEKNVAVKVEIDNTYSYIVGSSVSNDGELTIKDKTYFVNDTDRYVNTNERLFAAYHNDMEYSSFKNYIDKLGKAPSTGKDKEFTSDFSRVTVKGNRVLFIDSYKFDDTAPVKEVKKSGEEVYIYKDENNAELVKFIPNQVLGFTKDGIKAMSIKDIKANDVAHIYNKDSVIVRQDALSTGTYDRYREGADSSFIQFNGTNYLVNETNKLRPVYSLDGTRFLTLFANKGALDLDPLKDQKVSILLDVNDNLQSIVGDIKFNEGVFVIDEIDRRSTTVIGSDNSKSTVTEEYNSILNFLGSKDKRTIDDFRRGDLVYLFKDGNAIDKMVRLATAANIDQLAIPVVKTTKGIFELNKSWIKLEESKGQISNFLINNADVFIVEVDGDKVPRIEGTTIDNILDKAKTGSNLRAYVISNRYFYGMTLGNNIKTGSETDVAHTIIFTDFVGSTASLTREVMEVSYKFTPGRDTIIDGKDESGRTISRNVDKYANIPTLAPGDIVELGIDKDKVVFEAKIKISQNAMTYNVVDIERYSSSRSMWINLEDSKGVKKELFIDRDAFYFDDVEKDDIVSISLNTEGDIDVITVRDPKTSVTGTW